MRTQTQFAIPLLLAASSFGGHAVAESSQLKAKVDMLEYLDCTETARDLGSQYGLWAGEIYHDKPRPEPGAEPLGMTLYACPSKEWILFNPESELGASYFGVRASWIREKCAGSSEIVVKEIWDKETNPDLKFYVRISCAKIAKIL